jgi:hypothetical protein
METLNIIASICSISSLIITMFLASKVINIEKKLTIKGRDNIVAGGDVNVGR